MIYIIMIVKITNDCTNKKLFLYIRGGGGGGASIHKMLH